MERTPVFLRASWAYDVTAALAGAGLPSRKASLIVKRIHRFDYGRVSAKRSFRRVLAAITINPELNSCHFEIAGTGTVYVEIGCNPDPDYGMLDAVTIRISDHEGSRFPEADIDKSDSWPEIVAKLDGVDGNAPGGIDFSRLVTEYARFKALQCLTPIPVPAEPVLKSGPAGVAKLAATPSLLLWEQRRRVNCRGESG